ncbi:F-box domain-containing protein [Mycena indigotica]|uniref:F-box domain-containing protein n=1 Tax=Mycena indigotica TaxID=2126181 RepID=A0A8H6SXQ7_9AGAR|nr:F-box domain-containing protein [Mycena indigotica]KAF7306596.1 F-box domain-containing protein [Mycena indigotica]
MPAQVPKSPPLIFGIPSEVLQEILLLCHPRDVAAFCGTCQSGGDRGMDQYLWRQLFLGLFDVPPNVDSCRWRCELSARMKAERDVCRAGRQDAGLSEADLRAALETLVIVAAQISDANDSTDSLPSRNAEWLNNVLHKSRILDTPSSLSKDCQYVDRLRTYMALSLHENDDESIRRIRTQSRCFIYDLRNYHEANSWGPYLGDKINWTHLNYVVNVIVTNLREQPALNLPIPPHGLAATRAYSAPGSRSPEDWAGVEGTWHRYVSFMDYRDLFAFNFGGILANHRDPAFFDNLHFREATRLIELTLHLIPREEMRIKFSTNDPPVATHPDYPTLYFSGTSRGISMLHLQPTVQGLVYMDLDGIPRWKFTSMQSSTPQWSSEGVQLGKPGSQMGLAGVWSAFGHDRDDPAGPFWAWKVSSD